jgi:hypothetical protein
MSTAPLPPHDEADFERLDHEDKMDKYRNRAIIVLVALIGCGVAFWVGSLVNANQEEAAKAQDQTEQAQVEKFNLAQQVADACADPAAKALDEQTYTNLCTDARQIVQEGPQGPQGIQGIRGLPGINGVDGKDGTDGAVGLPGDTGDTGDQGPQGEKGDTGATGPQGEKGDKGDPGEPGAVGPQGPAGADGKPPFSWVVFDDEGNEIERCVQDEANFDPQSPRYICTRADG